MSEIQFRCQHCGVKLETEESVIGKDITCPACNRTIHVDLDTVNKKRQKSTVPTSQNTNLRYQPSWAQGHQTVYDYIPICTWAIVVGLFAFLELSAGGILLVNYFSPELAFDYIMRAIGQELVFSSIFMFLFSWFIQQIYISNELQKVQITLLAKIENKLEE